MGHQKISKFTNAFVVFSDWYLKKSYKYDYFQLNGRCYLRRKISDDLIVRQVYKMKIFSQFIAIFLFFVIIFV